MKSATALCVIWQSTQNQVIKYLQTKSLTIPKIELLWKQVEVGTKNLMNYCQDLPYSELNDEIKKQQKIISQQDITFKQSQTKVVVQGEDEEIK